MESIKTSLNCLKCHDKYIDSRDYVFCTYNGKTKYVGRKKDFELPKWCPKCLI